MKFIEKLQKQPEHVRKIILWAVVIVIGIGLAIWWLFYFSQKIKEFKQEELIEQLNLPVLEEKFKEFPEKEVPEFLKTEKEIKKQGEKINEE